MTHVSRMVPTNARRLFVTQERVEQPTDSRKSTTMRTSSTNLAKNAQARSINVAAMGVLHSNRYFCFSSVPQVRPER